MVIRDLRAGSYCTFQSCWFFRDICLFFLNFIFSYISIAGQQTWSTILISLSCLTSCGFYSCFSRFKCLQFQSCNAWKLWTCMTLTTKFLSLWNPLSSEVKPGIHLTCKSVQKNSATDFLGLKSTLNAISHNFLPHFLFGSSLLKMPPQWFVSCISCKMLAWIQLDPKQYFV